MTAATTTPTVYRSYVSLSLTGEVRAALADPHTMHVLVSNAYAQHMSSDSVTNRADLSILYAVDRASKGQTVRVVTQSTSRADWTGQPAVHDLTEVDDDHVWQVGDQIAFQMTCQPMYAVPGKRRKDPDTGKLVRGRKVPARSDAERRAWVGSRLSRAGLADVQFQVRRVDGQVSRHLTKRHRERSSTGNKAGWSLVTVTGTATVSDPEALRRGQIEGIGPAKSYGAGLLLIKDM